MQMNKIKSGNVFIGGPVPVNIFPCHVNRDRYGTEIFRSSFCSVCFSLLLYVQISILRRSRKSLFCVLKGTGTYVWEKMVVLSPQIIVTVPVPFKELKNVMVFPILKTRNLWVICQNFAKISSHQFKIVPFFYFKIKPHTGTGSCVRVSQDDNIFPQVLKIINWKKY